LNHLIGGGQQRLRDGQAEGLRGLEIDDEFETSRLLNRNVGRFRPAQDFVDELGGAPTAARSLNHLVGGG
jgi:hypothetical protein